MNRFVTERLKNVRICVVGGGVAGLAAASRAVSLGAKVTLFERRLLPGGRTFSFRDRATGLELDNGQHIFLSSYHRTLNYLELIGTRNLVSVKPLHIEWRGGARTGRLLLSGSSRFAQIRGFLKQRHLTIIDRVRLLAGIAIAVRSAPAQGQNVSQWLAELEQKESARRYFWDPLCLAVMNESPSDASARVFFEVLRRVFGDPQGAGILWSDVGLTATLVRPGVSYIRENGGRVNCGIPVTSLDYGEARVVVRTVDQTDAFDYAVMTVPPWHMPMINGSPVDIHSTVSSILSAYVWFLRDQPQDALMVGCIGTRLQWITWRGPRIAAITISAANDLMDVATDDLTNLIRREIAQVTGVDSSDIARILVLKERKATLKTESRPRNLGRVKFAGDWAVPELPCTIETACESAHRAIEEILRSENS